MDVNRIGAEEQRDKEDDRDIFGQNGVNLLIDKPLWSALISYTCMWTLLDRPSSWRCLSKFKKLVTLVAPHLNRQTKTATGLLDKSISGSMEMKIKHDKLYTSHKIHFLRHSASVNEPHSKVQFTLTSASATKQRCKVVFIKNRKIEKKN